MTQSPPTKPTSELLTLGKNQYIYKEHMSIEEWLDTRSDGIGGSDVGVIVGVNPWTSPTRLFHEKLGTHPPKDLNKNDSIYWGRKNEENIRQATEYWDHTDELQYTLNDLYGKKTFSHPDFPFFALHTDFPHLRANVDALGYSDLTCTKEHIVKGIFQHRQPEPEKVVEIKTIKGKSRDMWADGIPIGYKYQVMSYMLQFYHQNPDIYGEIYSLVDGANLHCYRLEFDEDMVVEILEKTKEFWSRIELAKEVLDKYGETEQALKEIQDYEPEPDGLKDYADFLSERELKRIQEEKNKIKSTDEFEKWAYEYTELTANEAEVKGRKQWLVNQMKSYMRKNESSIVMCDNGKVSFNKRIYVNVK